MILDYCWEEQVCYDEIDIDFVVVVVVVVLL